MYITVTHIAIINKYIICFSKNMFMGKIILLFLEIYLKVLPSAKLCALCGEILAFH